MTRVLVVGPPRSGTTWTGQVLGRSVATRYVHEPDGAWEPYALKAKIGHATQIALRPGASAPAYERLWDGAFAGGRRPASRRAKLARRLFDAASPQDRNAARRRGKPTPQLRLALALATPLSAEPSANVVVKSVQSCCAVEWLDARYAPRVVVVQRHPLNVLASWKEFGFGSNPELAAEVADFAERSWDVRLAPDHVARFTRQAMVLGVLLGALHEATARNPHWSIANHEELVVDPERGFRELATKVGLEFSDDAAEYLRASDQKGEGYATKRDRTALRAKWQRILTEDDLQIAADTFALFPDSLGLAAALTEREHLA